ncbi:phage holin family protein [Flavobacterium sp. J27]|uniref:phage holin family protein n=1 Tax=Flavobacterium sp. J27 TaxID=2060419 RepID=UPI001031BF69|nr:phage holin family protein [Flavobacterium sp. J27]
MKLLIKLLITTVLVVVISNFLPGITVASYKSAFIVAVVLALLNTFLKPLLILLTIPATILTLGLFLLVINAVLILIGDYFVSGFTVSGFWTAFLFSIILSVCQSILNGIFIEKEQ